MSAHLRTTLEIHPIENLPGLRSLCLSLVSVRFLCVDACAGLEGLTRELCHHWPCGSKQSSRIEKGGRSILAETRLIEVCGQSVADNIPGIQQQKNTSNTLACQVKLQQFGLTFALRTHAETMS